MSDIETGAPMREQGQVVDVPPPQDVETERAIEPTPEWQRPIYETWWPELQATVRSHLERGDHGTAIANAATLVEQTVRRVADAPSDLGGVKLNAFAFAPRSGRLVSHLQGGEADGLQKFFDGLSQAIRNKGHHQLAQPANPQEAIQTLSAFNLGLTLAKRHAYDTYLRPFTSDRDFHYLLQVRHVVLEGGHSPVRFVTYVSGGRAMVGSILAAVETPVGWRRVVGGIRMEQASLLGNIDAAQCNDDGPLQVFATFAPVGTPGVFAVVPVIYRGGALVLLAAPAEATWSIRRPHEFKDLMGRGKSQLISYAATDQPGQLIRRFFELQGDTFAPLHAEAVQERY